MDGAVQPHVAGVDPVDAGQHLDARGLAGPVPPEPSQHLAGGGVERDVAHRLRAAEGLRQTGDRQERVSCRSDTFRREHGNHWRFLVGVPCDPACLVLITRLS